MTSVAAVSLKTWQCPGCGSPVRHWKCTGCQVLYYSVGSIPVLLQDPEAYRRRTESHLIRYCRQQDVHVRRAEQVLADPAQSSRWDLMHRIIAGVRHNKQLGQSQLDKLVSGFGRAVATADDAPAPESPETRNYGLFSLAYLRNDWCGTESGERQIRTVTGGLKRWIDRHSLGGPALILGAGTGRYVFELAPHFESIIAVELCYPYAELFERLQSGPVTFTEMNFAHPRSMETVVQTYTAAMPANRPALDRIQYVIADARHIPHAKASRAVAFSIYFTDVLPLTELLPEVRRVLEPGGVFVHFGPLHYHFRDLKAMLTPEEVRTAFEANGFEWLGDDWMEMDFFRSAAATSHSVHQTWSFAARMRA